MSNSHKVLYIIVFCGYISSLVASSMAFVGWPKLPTEGFISGKPATKADVDADRAVFAYVNGKGKSTPLTITIPQYAFMKKKGQDKKIRIIVVQAEKVNGMNVVGYINIKTGKRAITLLKHVKLLGQSISPGK